MIPNPFEQDVIYDPRRLQDTVAELNGGVLRRLIDEFEAIAVEPPLPRWTPRKAVLITSAEAGYGKSHLIGRLFAELAGHASLIYINPFVDAGSSWRSLLGRIMQELKLPERLGVEFANAAEPSQLEQLSHGIFVNMTVHLIEAGTIKTRSKAEAIDRLKCEPLPKLRTNERYLDWLGAHFKDYVELLGQTVRLRASMLSWLKTLFLCAYITDDPALREGCHDWLNGGSVDAETAKEIGLAPRDNPPVELTREEANRLCQDRFMDFCQLARWHRPFLFCFDQTENYGNQEALARELAIVVERMVTEASHQMTIITANTPLWRMRLWPHWEDAHRDRLRAPLELAGLDRKMATELIGKRLERWGADAYQRGRMLDETWLHSIFGEAPQLGIRQFLKLCRERWETSPVVKPTLEELFQKYFQEVRSKPDRRRFDRDALLWFIQTAMGRGALEEVAATGRGARYYEVVGWTAERRYLLGLEEGTHWRRWQSIIETARAQHEKDPTTVGVMIRTADQPSVPRPTWQGVIRLLKEARGRYFHIAQLDAEETIAINAMHELYDDAGSGDIEYSQEETAAFAARKLESIAYAILHGGVNEGEVQAGPDPSPSAELIGLVRDFVKRERVTTFEALMNRLEGRYTEEEISNARGCIAEIEVYPTPNSIMLLWKA